MTSYFLVLTVVTIERERLGCGQKLIGPQFELDIFFLDIFGTQLVCNNYYYTIIKY